MRNDKTTDDTTGTRSHRFDAYEMFGEMRSSTPEEREAYRRMLEGMSVDLGIDIHDLPEDGTPVRLGVNVFDIMDEGSN